MFDIYGNKKSGLDNLGKLNKSVSDDVVVCVSFDYVCYLVVNYGLMGYELLFLGIVKNFVCGKLLFSGIVKKIVLVFMLG